MMRPRSYIGFAAISAIVLVIHLALYVDGQTYIGFMMQQLEQSFDISGKIINGNLAAYLILQTLIVQMPLLVALVAGDAFSGEAANGTIRLLATRPVSRSRMVTAKFLAGSVYTLALVLWLGVLALLGGLLIFGSGDLIVPGSYQISILPAEDTLWRFGYAMLVACLSLTVITSLSMMLSVFTDNSIGPIVASIAIVIIFTIIGTMEFPLFEKISPFLFTTHMIIWRAVFESPPDVAHIAFSCGILLLHVAAFMGITYYFFNKRDILS
jgi:ABC-2 type transport system permease protein